MGDSQHRSTSRPQQRTFHVWSPNRSASSIIARVTTSWISGAPCATGLVRVRVRV